LVEIYRWIVERESEKEIEKQMRLMFWRCSMCYDVIYQFFEDEWDLFLHKIRALMMKQPNGKERYFYC
jgi:hypothetical protein